MQPIISASRVERRFCYEVYCISAVHLVNIVKWPFCLQNKRHKIGQCNSRVLTRRMQNGMYMHTHFPKFRDGDAAAAVVWQDRTEERRLERSLIQSAKLSAVGRLTAGIAHELNNPLTIISTASNCCVLICLQMKKQARLSSGWAMRPSVSRRASVACQSWADRTVCISRRRSQRLITVGA